MAKTADLSRRHSMRLYVRGVFRHWVLLAIFVVGMIGNGATLFGSFALPQWAWLALAALGFVGAQFSAYHDVRVERDGLVAKTSANPSEQRVGFKTVLSKADDAIWYRNTESDYFHDAGWATTMAQFIEAALGTGEASRFTRGMDIAEGEVASDWDFDLGVAYDWLNNLIERSDTVAIRPDFEPEQWEDRFSKEKFS
jgi:hypothetical protein